MNLRTVEGGTKARLQKAADERHAWSLQQSKDEVEALKQTLEEDTYMMMLDREAVMLRAKKRSMKDRGHRARLKTIIKLATTDP